MRPKTLLIYRSGIARNEFDETYNKYNHTDVYAIVENDMVRRYMEYFYPEITFFKIKDLLQDRINMKFDYIVGNPPYQYPKGTKESSKKLYIDITKKVIPLLKNAGMIAFITPITILQDGRKNTVFSLLQDMIVSVDLDTRYNFKIAQIVCSWVLKKEKRMGDIIVKRNGNLILRKRIDDICTEEDEAILSIINKVNYKKNGRKHLKINDTSNEGGILQKDLMDEKTDEYNIEVLTNSQRYPIKYAKDVSSQKIRTKIIIPMQGGYKNGCTISDIPVSNGLMINNSRSTYTLEELQHIKSFLESKLICYCVVNYNKLFPKASYAFLFLVPEIDLTKEKSDTELYAEFNLTEDEIKVIEKWYSEWKKS